MPDKRFLNISHYNGLRIKLVLFIAVFWTAIDLVISWLNTSGETHVHTFWYCEIFIFLVSIIVGYLFVYRLKRLFEHLPLWLSFLLRSFILLALAFTIVFILQLFNGIVFDGLNFSDAVGNLKSYALYQNWLVRKIIYWLSIFFVTQLILIINEKYSPSVFVDILTGKYSKPQQERRIVMFMDLRDSTPIAEKLGHHLYFQFIRDFIYQVSKAIIECEGTIYQYVGDEVVCSWPATRRNAKKCLTTILQSRRNIHHQSEKFRRKYGVIPEFRVGIHAGEVSVGEIGIMKKDLAMSGDTMNTTARIRSACNELKHHFVVSKDFIELTHLHDYQYASLGNIDLKGKDKGIELFNLKI